MHPSNPFEANLVKNFKKFCMSSKKRSHFEYSIDYKSQSNIGTGAFPERTNLKINSNDDLTY